MLEGTKRAPVSIDDAILDAARGCILDFGVRRTTLAEVARRAGVSRPTVYRRWQDTRALLGDLLTRELHETISRPADESGDIRDRLVRTVVEGTAAIRAHPLFVKIFRTDAEQLLTYIVRRLGRSQREVIAAIAKAVKAGQAEGSIMAGDAEQMATMLLLIAQSAVQSAGMVAETLPPSTLDAQLALAVDGYLAPAREGA
ncbi:MAG: TetR/AcrR family transcriptional regulator [Sciscionella sp.]